MVKVCRVNLFSGDVARTTQTTQLVADLALKNACDFWISLYGYFLVSYLDFEHYYRYYIMESTVNSGNPLSIISKKHESTG